MTARLRRIALGLLAIVLLCALWEGYKAIDGTVFGYELPADAGDRTMPHVWDVVDRLGDQDHVVGPGAGPRPGYRCLVTDVAPIHPSVVEHQALRAFAVQDLRQGGPLDAPRAEVGVVEDAVQRPDRRCDLVGGGTVPLGDGSEATREPGEGNRSKIKKW